MMMMRDCACVRDERLATCDAAPADRCCVVEMQQLNARRVVGGLRRGRALTLLGSTRNEGLVPQDYNSQFTNPYCRLALLYDEFYLLRPIKIISYCFR